jgi:hypothetical protein
MGWSTSKRAPAVVSREEALGCTPVKNRYVRESRLPGGEVVLHYPVSAPPWAARVARWLRKNPGEPRVGNLELDALGTAVWDMIDSQRSLREIAAAFAGSHQLALKEAQVAVSQFARELGRRGLIGLR